MAGILSGNGMENLFKLVSIAGMWILPNSTKIRVGNSSSGDISFNLHEQVSEPQFKCTIKPRNSNGYWKLEFCSIETKTYCATVGISV